MEDRQLHRLGNNIRRLRKEARMSQLQFAEHAGVEPGHFQDVEGGKVDVGIKYLDQVRRSLAGNRPPRSAPAG